MTANYTGDLFVATASATTSTATVNLSATITVGSGDISTATVQFYNHVGSTDTNIGTSYTITPINATTESVSATWSVDIGSTNNSQTFTVGIRVGGNYSRNAPDDYSMVTVSKPVGGSTTGGGFVINTGSSGGSVAPDVGEKTTYGFEAKYSSKGNSGNVNLVVHHGINDYQFTATSISTVTFPAADSIPGIRATFSGTGNILDITNPAQPVTLYTGATIQASVHDDGEPGTSDTVGFTIRLADTQKTLWYSNNLISGQTVEQKENGGNIQVRAAQLAADLPAAHVAAPPLTLDMLKPIVVAAEARWEAAGIDPKRLNAVMENVSIRLDNLTGTDLAWSSPGIITIDRNADGFGWFIDPTPGDDSEFTPNAVNSPAQGHMDLLSVVAHEIGLHLGFGENDGTVVMAQYLPAGVRHVPLPQATLPTASTLAQMIANSSNLVPISGPVTVLDTPIQHNHALEQSPHKTMPETVKLVSMVATRPSLVPASGDSVGLDGSVLHDLALERMTSTGLWLGRHAKE